MLSLYHEYGLNNVINVSLTDYEGELSRVTEACDCEGETEAWNGTGKD